MLHFIVVTWKVNIPASPGSIVEKLKRIDVFGAISLVSAIALFLLGASLGGNEYPWGTPVVYGSILASLCLIGIFVFVEKYVAIQPVR